MKTLFFILFFLNGITVFSQSYLEFGLEVGHHITTRIPKKQTLNPEVFSAVGTKIGLFAEREVTDFLNLRFNAFYSIRYHNPYMHWGHTGVLFPKLHAFTFPIKAVFKAGKIVHFGIGPDPILLINDNQSNKQAEFHMGICGDVTFRIRKLMRLSFYCNYDFATIEYKNHPKFNNFVFGVSFAFAFKKFKKRRVIYSPG